MIRLRLFAFDDEHIKPFHDALMQIHRHSGTDIAVFVGDGSGDHHKTRDGIRVECTYAAPGKVPMQQDGELPSMHGRPEVLSRVLDYAADRLRAGDYDIILLDNTVSGPDGVQADYGVNTLLPLAREGSPNALIAVITGYPMIAEERTETIRRAFNGEYRADLWLTKRAAALCDTFCSIILMAAREKLLRERVRNAEEDNKRLRTENAAMEEELRIRLQYDECEAIVSWSPVFKDAVEMARKAAVLDRDVLITGESGTGKELIARLIHQTSDRKSGPFVALNCAAIPENLIEAELFGHKKGAFTGAGGDRLGQIGAAEGGTLFLDEIGDLPLQAQVKLLRVLQDHMYMRVGGDHPKKVDIRVVAATNANLHAKIADGQFREDLFHRLDRLSVQLPPLRERPEDIVALADFYLDKHSKEQGKDITSISDDARRVLLAYGWPGNVRELDNAIYKAVFLCRSNEMTIEDLPPRVLQGARATENIRTAARPEEISDGSQAPLDGWLARVDLQELRRLCSKIWQSRGKNIENNPDNVVAVLAHSPFYLRAVLAAFWVEFCKDRDMFNQVFGFLSPPREKMELRQYLQKAARDYPAVFPAAKGRKNFGISDLVADGEDLREAGFRLQLM